MEKIAQATPIQPMKKPATPIKIRTTDIGERILPDNLNGIGTNPEGGTFLGISPKPHSCTF